MHSHFRLPIAASAILISLAGCGGSDNNASVNPQGPQTGQDSLLARTETGQIKGFTKSNAGASADIFLGIPYAAPPVGALRWAAPARPVAWQGVRDGTVAPPICSQGTKGSEDCLYLNIYRPAGTDANAALPVMLYAYGSGNVDGGANNYDATRLANDNGIIVVVPNYRLGALGFLNHPAIAPVDQGGNYGVLDIKAALQWVQRNISTFGGNPGKVTLATLSAGATNACRLMVDNTAANLFHAVTLSSDDCIHDVDTPEEAVVRATNLANKVGCTDAATVASCLRSKNHAELVAAGGQGPQGSGWNPTATTPAATLIASGNWNKVPVLIGSTATEGRYVGVSFVNYTEQNYSDWVTRLVGAANTSAVLARYPATKYTGQYAIPYVVGDIVTDAGMRGLGGCTNVSLAESLSAQTPTYYYQFEDMNAPYDTTPPGYQYAASHGSDFETYGFPSDASTSLSTRFTAAQRQLSDEMIKYWGSFTKNHDPSVSGQAVWPRMTGANSQFLSLRPAGASQANPVSSYKQQHNCDLWATMPLILERGEI